MSETAVVVHPDEDVKKQEALKAEMAELNDDSISMPETKPDEETEVKTKEKASEKPADDASVKPPAEKTEVQSADTGIDYKAEFEKEKAHRTNLDKALHEMRVKRKSDLETMAVLQSKIKPDAKLAEGEEEKTTSIDPEVEKIIRSTVAPELEEVKTEIRVQRFKQDEAEVISTHGKEKHKAAMDAFSELITPESHLYDPAIHESFMKSNTPAQFAFRIGMAQGLDGYIENVRKETAEKVKKETIEGLKNSANRTIPSLSQVNGGRPANAQPNTLRKEMDEL